MPEEQSKRDTDVYMNQRTRFKFRAMNIFSGLLGNKSIVIAMNRILHSFHTVGVVFTL